ncbi:hypothetical protein [Litchfieldia salsa]|uniref:Uncharacterized protein n=1 Tax=Litchfieldia salsa TaxID=930152 RepID=A0A1H0WRW8_9BACI|nr:hypothetical protein [Litchfieldia salsa]SDP92976.1 hypothetical protein SAMN05216565_113101 [Litchfieldia salsa]
MYNDKKVENSLIEQLTQEEHVNQLDPEMDLRNVNFATGENKYLTENPDII